MIDLRQTIEYAKFLKLEGWKVERVDGINYFLRKLPLIGYLLKIQRPEEVRYKDIKKLSEKYRVFQIVIEPQTQLQAQDLLNYGYKLSKSPFLPTKSLHIDLTQPQKVIYKDFQRNIKTGVKRGELLKIKSYSSEKEIKDFREAWKKSVKISRYVPTVRSLLNLKKSFPQNKLLFLASHNISGRIIGGVIFTISSHGLSNYITSYLYGFTSQEGRASLVHASLLYQGILWGKINNCKIFDFEGLYDNRFPNKSWLGFSRFKKSFGGYEVLYPGCYTKFKLPLKEPSY